jgi:citrate lyase subunit beta / citryl-CoA lyase
MPHKHKVVPADISRSWLLFAATKPDEFDKAAASGTDQLVLDVEDAVDPLLKPQALADVIKWLKAGNRAWVRINDFNSPFWADDCAGLKGVPNLLGVMLAKVEGADQVEATFDALGGTTPVIALVESALGIEEARNIACARGAFRLAFGSGDYRRDTGTAADNMAMLYPRSKLVTASRIGNLPGPIDGPTITNSFGQLREASEHTVVLGLTGKLTVDAGQIAVINETICPTQADVTWARDFLADFEARGRVIRDGSDLPRLGRAEKINKLANAFGIHPIN